MTTPGAPVLGLVLRIAVLIVVLILAVRASAWVTEALSLQIMPHNEAMFHKIILIALGAYVLLMATPFVPGAEIGVALMTALGGAIAPVVWGATILALSLSFVIGRAIPAARTCRLLRRLRLRRAARLVARLHRARQADRIDGLLGDLDGRLAPLVLRHRYLALALALNLPGNAVIGGGGGLALAAGLSGAFHPLAFLATVTVAVLPVPLIVFLSAPA
ncbi:hypothetical protein DXV76_07330 [Rhodobacteraceae bacterium CCMM004]|nr:hypothetical protein DXV76_07330 [Rhodobacteraceae bacterium CCMM004]